MKEYKDPVERMASEESLSERGETEAMNAIISRLNENDPSLVNNVQRRNGSAML